MRATPLVEYVRWAYDTQLSQVIAPSWVSEARFDITATAGSPATEAEMRRMMQTLLAERFKLVLRSERRELPVLEITESKHGHKLQPTDVEGSPNFRMGTLTATASGATLAPLLEILSGFMKMPVVDRTGLNGKYNYTVDINSFITDEVRRNAEVELPVAVAQALQEQLGLKMSPTKSSIEVLVVEHMEKQPTEN